MSTAPTQRPTKPFLAVLRLSGLRANLIVLILLVLVPIFVLVRYTSVQDRQVRTSEVEQNAAQLAKVTVRDEQNLLDNARQPLVRLSKQPIVHTPDDKACSPFLAEELKQAPQFLQLGITNLKGDGICTAITSSTLANFSDRAWFQKTVQTKDFAIGDYAIGRITKKASIGVGYPVLNNSGQIDGVVYITIGVETLNKLAEQANLPTGSVFTIVDTKGTDLARYPDPEHLVGKTADGPLFQ